MASKIRYLLVKRHRKMLASTIQFTNNTPTTALHHEGVRSEEALKVQSHPTRRSRGMPDSSKPNSVPRPDHAPVTAGSTPAGEPDRQY